MFLATALAKSRFSSVKAAAIAANATVAMVAFVMPGINYSPTAKELIGFDDRFQSDSRRRRWATAYFVMCRMWGLPVGSLFIPCYMCGRIFSAWTLDADHVHPFGGSHPANLALGCATCNRRHKGDRMIPNDAAVAIIASAAYGVGYVQGGRGLNKIDGNMWNASERRISAKNVRQNSHEFVANS